MSIVSVGREGEYESKAFNDFYVFNGIRRSLMVTYASQQNRVAERKNQIRIEMDKNTLNIIRMKQLLHRHTL